MAISTTYANQILDHLFGRTSMPEMSDTIYLGLCSTEPRDGAVTTNTDGVTTNFEPTGSGYQRVLIGGKSETANKLFSSAGAGKIKNAVDIQMPAAKEAWGKMNYWFISNLKEIGKPAILWGELKDKDTNTVGVEIGERTVPVFYAGELEASIDVPLTEEEASE